MDEEIDPCEEYSVLVDDDSAFQVGETFESYDELVSRLNDHCERSLVRYARRDTKSVRFATKKLDKRVNPKLVYYMVRYTCVYGGRKMPSRALGIRPRKNPSAKVDCPASISLRVSKCGQRLEVSAVQNVHNHPISRELFKKMYHCRRIPIDLRKQVADLHTIGARKKFLMKYLQANSDVEITSKHYFNMISRNKRSIMHLSNDRIKELFELIEREDPEEYNAINKDQLYKILDKNYVEINVVKTEYESQNEHQSDDYSSDPASSEENTNKIRKLVDEDCNKDSRKKNILSNLECGYVNQTNAKDESQLINENDWNIIIKNTKKNNELDPLTNLSDESNRFSIQNDKSPKDTIGVVNNQMPKITIETLMTPFGESDLNQNSPSKTLKILKLPRKYEDTEKCMSCGKFAKETKEFIKNLKKERDQLIKETAHLMLLRDRLKDEITQEKAKRRK